MGDTVIVETPVDEVVSIVTQGPQGPSGSEAATLTTTGDLLYRAALANARLPIGSEGQVLKVASGLPAWGNESGSVTSVAGRTGDVTLAVADVANAVSDSDARLSDDRNPLSHAASHAAAGSDPVFDQDLNTTDSVEFVEVRAQSLVGLTVKVTDDFVLGFSAEFTAPSLTDDRELQFPDASGTIALQGAITTSGLTQSTARILGRTTASTGAVEEIQIGSGLSLSAGELSATGGSGGGEVRSDFVSPYTYTGLADAGTSESTASWTIRRSEFDAGGSFVATLTASAVKWDDRLTASYA
jgi:hypothetical protein